MADQDKKRGESDKPFVGVPSDQVGRGAGMDPPGDPGEDNEACRATVQNLKHAAQEGRASTGTTEQSAPRSAGESGPLDTGESSGKDLGSGKRPPSDS